MGPRATCAKIVQCIELNLEGCILTAFCLEFSTHRSTSLAHESTVPPDAKLSSSVCGLCRDTHVAATLISLQSEAQHQKETSTERGLHARREY